MRGKDEMGGFCGLESDGVVVWIGYGSRAGIYNAEAGLEGMEMVV